ncbi:hypothetical protein BC831DRAFT_449921 [Entophlyctis helioformis]|nr:hypothetical protein BC831DRAFT_449921 [Entophlyctis helioformis]
MPNGRCCCFCFCDWQRAVHGKQPKLPTARRGSLQHLASDTTLHVIEASDGDVSMSVLKQPEARHVSFSRGSSFACYTSSSSSSSSSYGGQGRHGAPPRSVSMPDAFQGLRSSQQPVRRDSWPASMNATLVANSTAGSSSSNATSKAARSTRPNPPLTISTSPAALQRPAKSPDTATINSLDRLIHHSSASAISMSPTTACSLLALDTPTVSFLDSKPQPQIPIQAMQFGNALQDQDDSDQATADVTDAVERLELRRGSTPDEACHISKGDTRSMAGGQGSACISTLFALDHPTFGNPETLSHSHRLLTSLQALSLDTTVPPSDIHGLVDATHQILANDQLDDEFVHDVVVAALRLVDEALGKGLCKERTRVVRELVALLHTVSVLGVQDVSKAKRVFYHLMA